MKTNTVLRNAFVALGGLLLFLPVPMAAQGLSPKIGIGYINPGGIANVPLLYNGPEVLNLSAAVSTGTVAFPLGGGMAPGTVSVTTQYNLNPGRVVTIEAGFNSPIALADTTGDQISATAVSAVFSSGGGTVTSMPNCMSPASGQTAIQFGLSCGWITFPSITTANQSATHTHTIALNLNPNQSMPPGTYTGTLVIAAYAN